MFAGCAISPYQGWAHDGCCTGGYNHKLQHSLMNESARAPTYDAIAYLCTQIPNVTSGESTVGESTFASALQHGDSRYRKLAAPSHL